MKFKRLVSAQIVLIVIWNVLLINGDKMILNNGLITMKIENVEKLTTNLFDINDGNISFWKLGVKRTYFPDISCISPFPTRWEMTEQIWESAKVENLYNTSTGMYESNLKVKRMEGNKGIVNCSTKTVSHNSSFVVLNLLTKGNDIIGVSTTSVSNELKKEMDILRCPSLALPCASPTRHSNYSLLVWRNDKWNPSNDFYLNNDREISTRICDDDIQQFMCQYQSGHSVHNTTYQFKDLNFKHFPEVSSLYVETGQELNFTCFGDLTTNIAHNELAVDVKYTEKWLNSYQTVKRIDTTLKAYDANLSVTCKDTLHTFTWDINILPITEETGDNFTLDNGWLSHYEESRFSCTSNSAYNLSIRVIHCKNLIECELLKCCSNNWKHGETMWDEEEACYSASVDISEQGLIACSYPDKLRYYSFFTGLNNFKYFHGFDRFPDDSIITIKPANAIEQEDHLYSEFFVCQLNPYMLTMSGELTIEYRNGSRSAIPEQAKRNKTRRDRGTLRKFKGVHANLVYERFIVYSEMKYIYCGSAWLNKTGGWKEVKYQLTEDEIAIETSILQKPLFYVSTGVFFLILVFGIVVVVIRQRNLTRKLKRHLNEKEIDAFYNGDKNPSRGYMVHVDSVDYALRMPYNSYFEIEEENISLDKCKLIGCGKSSLVYKGDFKRRKVAVKIPQEGGNVEDFKMLLAELKVLIYIGNHPNIVEFLGAITTNIQKLQVKIVLEFCQNGSLNNFLKKAGRTYDAMSKDCFDNFFEGQSVCISSISELQMIKWCYEIALGLEHLSKRMIIHADLATRNVVLDGCLRAKLADFGLSAKCMDYCAYVRKSKQAPLPWRWMALESLEECKFTLSSDIWAFGVVVWEIYSFGKPPYPSHNWNETFIKLLKDGFRLEKPDHCPEIMYRLMKDCWNEKLEARPRAREIRESLENMAKGVAQNNVLQFL